MCYNLIDIHKIIVEVELIGDWEVCVPSVMQFLHWLDRFGISPGQILNLVLNNASKGTLRNFAQFGCPLFPQFH